jgi:DNA-binding NarL/FixJ family response regulator
MSIGILLVDDHALVRDGLKVLLGNEPDLKVLGVAGDGQAAIVEASRLKPDVVTMDIAMPLLNGLEATRRILQLLPDTGIIVLSMHGSAEHVHRALQAGARGYLLKESAGTEVVAAVRAVYAGRRYLSAKIAETAIDDFVAVHHRESPLESLTARELEILKLVVDGRRNADVAQSLSISVKSVETYRSRLMKKLGVHDLPALVKFAIEHGLTELQ